MPRPLVALWFLVGVLWSPLFVLAFGPPLPSPRGAIVAYVSVTFVLTFVTCARTLRWLRRRDA